MIAIVAGCGTNIASIQFALERLGKESVLTVEAAIIKSATHVILPGVGSAKYAMSRLKELQLIDVISRLKQPVLGICLGMQLLFEYSDEGDADCLGVLPGKIKRLNQGEDLTVPHTGWNQVKTNNKKSLLMKGLANENYVYFVHSYAAPVNDYTTGITTYGQPFSSMVENNNFYGVQFHPERSGKIGAAILRNFIELES